MRAVHYSANIIKGIVKMNMEIFRMINNLANKSTILDKTMIFFSQYVPYIFMAVIVIVFILGIKQKKSEYRKIAVKIGRASCRERVS